MGLTSVRFGRCGFGLAMIVVMLVASSVQAQTTLQWKFAPGQVFDQVISQATKSTATVGPQTIETDMSQTLDAVWKVSAVDAAKVATVAAEITRIRVKIANAALNFEFDSASNAQPEGVGAMLAPAFKAMVNAKFTLKIDQRGKMLESEVSQETLDALNNLPNMGEMGSMVNKEMLVGMVQQGLTKMPEGPVAKGASWTDEMEIELPQVGKMSSNTKLTYEGPEQVDGKSLERISMQLTSKITPGEGSMFKISLKDQAASGVLYFDSSAGCISHSEVRQQMTMAMEVAGQVIDQKMNQTINSKLSPRGEAGAAAPTSSQSALRTWTDASGSYKLEAVFVSVTDGKVRLRKASGEQIEVPLNRLSGADQAYVSQVTAP